MSEIVTNEDQPTVEDIVELLQGVSGVVEKLIKDGNGNADSRLLIISKPLKILLFNPALKGDEATPRGESSVGKVVKAAGSTITNGESIAKNTNHVPVGQVVTKADLVQPDNNTKEKAVKVDEEDAAFFETLKSKTVEQLAGTKYSKDSQILIINKLNENGSTIEVLEEDTKATLADKIFAALHPEPAKTQE